MCSDVFCNIYSWIGVLMFGVNIHVQRVKFGVPFLHSQISIEDLVFQVCSRILRLEIEIK